MTTTTQERPILVGPHGYALLSAVMSAAARVVKRDGLTEPDDPSRPFQVDTDNWKAILEGDGQVIPPVILRYNAEGAPILYGQVVKRSDGRMAPGPRIQKPARAVEADDGGLTITCKGACGQTMGVKAFPTIKPGVRGNICRADILITREARRNKEK